MTDRELLELAAKAAGVSGYFDSGVIWYKNPFGDDAGFNPLNDDGDALRLAVKLKIDVEQCDECCYAMFYDEEAKKTRSRVAEYDNDPYVATRRAIVRAAAEIGRSMSADRDTVA